MLRKIARLMVKVFMECATMAVAGMAAMLVNDMLYEHMNSWYGEPWQALTFGVLTCGVLRYHARVKRQEAIKYWNVIRPRIDRVITAVNNACESDKEDKVA